MNRMHEHFRDPTLESPATDYYVVRIPWDSFVVGREDAARILAALSGFEAPTVIRCQTVSGSVVYVRSDAIMYVRESTRAQRDAERRFWNEIDQEDSDEE